MGNTGIIKKSIFRWSTTLDETRTDKDFNLVNLILNFAQLTLTDMNQREPLADPLLDNSYNSFYSYNSYN